ncbi:hypothetical protein ABZP36_008021 [Zizania latifolia]
MRGAYGENGNSERQPPPLGGGGVVGAAAATVEIVAATAAAVHKVTPPPAQSTASKMKARVKETFFPDDPFRSFKGQPLGARWLMAVKYLFPVLEWVPSYSSSLFKSDLVAGLTIASLAIPQARRLADHLFLLSALHLSIFFPCCASCFWKLVGPFSWQLAVYFDTKIYFI